MGYPDRRLLAVLLMLIVLSACATTRSTRAIHGQVVNPSNAPVSGVEVRAPGCAPTTTDANGKFTIERPPSAGRFAVTFRTPRYIETTRVYDTRPNASITDVLVIWPRAVALPLNATRGGMLSFPAGTVTIPPRALVDDRRQPVDGDVRVSFSLFDVMDPRQYRSAPGDFTARMRDNTIRQLETFGVFEIYVEGANGRRLDLRPGQRAEVELTVPEALEVPETVGSYLFEAATGLWVERDRFRRIGRRRLRAAISTVQSTWNADDPLITTCLVFEADCACGSGSTAGFSVDGLGVNYAQSFTAGENQCVNVKTNEKLILTPTHNGMNNAPVEITTPGDLANCTAPSGCRTVTFHCPSPNGITAPLLSCNDTGWYCADLATNPKPPFDVVWKAQMTTFNSNKLTLNLDLCGSDCDSRTYDAAELQSTCFYGYGLYEVKMQAASGPGLLTSFFVYTGPHESARQDEIDIEIFGEPGNDGCTTGSTVQFNYFVDGHENPQKKCLTFDATQGVYQYAFDWRAGHIAWYADANQNGIYEPSEELRKVTTADGPLPVLPGKIMVNMWAGTTDQPTKDWMGEFVYDASSKPFAIYELIRYTP